MGTRGFNWRNIAISLTDSEPQKEMEGQLLFWKNVSHGVDVKSDR
jgi:hypothetical protein